jgi:hypothetical protein
MLATSSIALQNKVLRSRTSDRVLARLLSPKPLFTLHTPYSNDRAAVEGYISSQFAEHYDAQLTEFMPQLISMQCQGRFSAAAGIRPALEGPLFAEQYVNRPAEQILSERLQTPVARSEIIEAGNLAATRPGTSQLFLALTTAVMRRAGFRWGIFTATDQVEKIVRKMNFSVTTLGPADPSRLGPDAACWGRYYETNPCVLIIDIADTEKRLHQSLLSDAALTLFDNTIEDLANRLMPQRANL